MRSGSRREIAERNVRGYPAGSQALKPRDIRIRDESNAPLHVFPAMQRERTVAGDLILKLRVPEVVGFQPSSVRGGHHHVAKAFEQTKTKVVVAAIALQRAIRCAGLGVERRTHALHDEAGLIVEHVY